MCASHSSTRSRSCAKPSPASVTAQEEGAFVSFDLATLYERLATSPGRQMRFLSLDGTLVTESFADVHANVVRLMEELRSSGVGAGDLVGLLGPNSYEWVVADLALLGLGCVSVALPADNRPQPQELR